MKKFLSILLTFCLMLTVVAVPLPAMAETTNKWDFDFESYSPHRYIGMSGRVDDIPEPGNEDNTVIKFDNNGIPYRSSDMDKSQTYTKSGSTYTKVASTVIDTALAADPNAYSNYYHYSAQVAVFNSNKAPYNNMEMYNAIDLDLQLETSTSYRITINYKRENLVNALYVHPVTWAEAANQRPNLTTYDEGRITIPVTDTADSAYTTVSTVITTPEAFNTSGTNGKYVGDTLRLVLYTGVADANNVVYFDNITVEKITYADLTYNYADEDTAPVVVEDLIVGDAIDYADLAPNKLGENNGVWYADEQGTNEAPATLPEGGLNVYEVVQTGVFDFNNYYRFQDYTGNSYGINNIDVINSIYADGNGNILVDTSKYFTTSSSGSTPDNTSASVGTLRRYVIAIGEAEASTDYKITVEYSYTATNADQRLVLTPLTGYGTLTYTNVNGGSEAQIIGDSVELPQGTNQSIDLFYSSADEFKINGDKTESAYSRAETGEVANSFYLNVKTTVNSHDDVANVVNATISKVTVTKAKGSVTYNVGEGASVSGESVDSSYVVNYYGDDTPVFPTVTYSDGRIVDHWTDDNNSGATVDAPVLNGSYTAVTKEPVEMVTVTLHRGDATQEVPVEKGTEYTLPDTEFTDTSWWNNATASNTSRFVGYEGEKIVVDEDTILYTAETYAKGTGVNMYKNWTVVEDATEGLTYLHKTMKDTDTATAWAHSAGTRLCTRLGVIEDGNTYKISVTYKAETDTPLDFVMVISAVNNPGGAMRSYLEETKKYLTVSEDTNGWTTATFYITADPPAEVIANNNGLDDTKDITGYEGLYLMVNKATGAHNVDIAIKETKVVDLGKVVEAKGASVLKDEKVVNGKQAMRYYFDYKTAGDGTTITIDGNDYPVVERGFLYTNGDITHYAAEGTKVSETYDHEGEYFVSAWSNTTYGYATSFQMWLQKAKYASGKNLLTYKGIKEGFENNWALDNGTVTFSTYVTGIPEESYSAKMMVRGYVIFEDENEVQHIVYSETVNRSVQGIKVALASQDPGNNEDHEE